jgi:hypothetical protein
MNEVCISSLGQFHMFELARQVYERGALKRPYTGTPRFLVRTVPPKNKYGRSMAWVGS